MKHLHYLLLIGLVSGCTFAQRTHVAYYDQSIAPIEHTHLWPASKPKPSTKQIDIYHDAKMPTRTYRELALFTVDGNHFEEPEAIAGFVERARAINADALIMKRDQTSGPAVQINATSAAPFSTVNSPGNDRALYCATAIAYTK